MIQRFQFCFLFVFSMLFFAGTAHIHAEEKATVNIQTIDSLKVETIVTVKGIVEIIRDEDEFILKDETGSIQVYIGPNAMPVETGDEVTVKGMFDNDIVKREIYAHEVIDQDGAVTKFERRYD